MDRSDEHHLSERKESVVAKKIFFIHTLEGAWYPDSASPLPLPANYFLNLFSQIIDALSQKKNKGSLPSSDC